jgi:hypothetical protein
LNCYLFLFWIVFLIDLFFFQFHPNYFFHLIFVSNLIMFLLVAIFKSFSLWIGFLQFHPYEYLISFNFYVRFSSKFFNCYFFLFCMMFLLICFLNFISRCQILSLSFS